MGYLGKVVYFVIYASLAFTAWYILIKGPFQDIMKGETISTETLQNIRGIKNKILYIVYFLHFWSI